jgi:hypothetical protein
MIGPGQQQQQLCGSYSAGAVLAGSNKGSLTTAALQAWELQRVPAGSSL